MNLIERIPGYVDVEIIKLLKAFDNLDQKTITQKLDKIDKSSISRRLKKLEDDDIIRLVGKKYQYRYGNQHYFKNPDKVINDLIKQISYMPVDFEFNENKDRVLLKDNWDIERISHWREEKAKMGVTEDALDKYLEEDAIKTKIFWEKVTEAMNTPPKYSPPDHNGVQHLLDENGKIIEVSKVDFVDELLKKYKVLKDK